jgi:hypothetical protein
MTTGDGGAGLRLLDQWHVDLLGPADMDDASVERLRIGWMRPFVNGRWERISGRPALLCGSSSDRALGVRPGDADGIGGPAFLSP